MKSSGNTSANLVRGALLRSSSEEDTGNHKSQRSQVYAPWADRESVGLSMLQNRWAIFTRVWFAPGREADCKSAVSVLGGSTP